MHFLASEKLHWSYLKQVHKIEAIEVNEIDWTIFHSIHKHLHFNKTQFGEKWRHNLLPTNKNENRVDPQHLISCPSCGAETKTHWHLLECRFPSRQTAWSNIWNKINDIFTKHKIDPRLQQIINNLLSSLVLGFLIL